MKKLLTILFVTLLFAAHGQDFIKSGGSFVKYGGSFVKASTTPAPTYTFQPETQAFWLRLADSTAVDISWKYDFDSLVVYLKDTNIWQDADAMYLFAFENAGDALLNIVGDTNNCTNNGASFTMAEGYKGNGSSAEINTHFNPTEDGVNYTLNDAAVFFYVNDPTTTGVFTFEYGMDASTVYKSELSNVGANLIFPSFNSNGVGYIAISDTYFSVGGWGMSRSGSSDYKIYHTTDYVTVTDASVSIKNSNTMILSRGGSGYVDSEHSFFYIGGSLSQAQLERLDEIIAWWLTKVSDNP